MINSNIVIENVTKIYQIKKQTLTFSKKKKESFTAVDSVSMSLNKGKIIGLLGLNGAGKTTIIKMISTILLPTTGSIKIDGKDIYSKEGNIKNRINIITGGERNIYWRLTPLENLEYFGRLYGLSKNILTQRIDYLLKQFDMENIKNTPVEKLSKGMKQRLQIMRGLINDPDYILLDEPTLGLDIDVAYEFRKYLRKLADEQNKGLLLTTHYVAEAEELCDYIYILDKGKIVFEGTPGEIKFLYNTTNIKAKVFVDNIQKAKIFASKHSFTYILDESSKCLILSTNTEENLLLQVDLLIKSGIEIRQIILVEKTLEEVLLSFLKREQK